MFCDRMDVGKSQRVPPFSFFFGIVRFFPENRKKIFSSIFSCFATEWMLKNLKGSPLSIFRHCEPRRATRSIFLVCNFFKKNSKNFRFSTTVKEYLTLGSLFAIFEPWIWRRLGPVPICERGKNGFSPEFPQNPF